MSARDPKTTDREDPAVLDRDVLLAQATNEHILRWLPVLAPPLFVLIDQLASYAMVHPVCEAKKLWPLFVPTAVSLAVTVGCGLLCWRRMVRTPEHAAEATRKDKRAAFLAKFGLAMSVLCFLAIAAMFIAKLTLGPCDR